jgi:mono/diheme cytochrome c family protein
LAKASIKTFTWAREMRLKGVECEAAVHGRTATLLFGIALAGFVGGMAIHARGTRQTPETDQSLSAEKRASLLAKGKELFLARCGRCHGENGDKPLRTGMPLSERGLSAEVIARAVKGRLGEGTEAERLGVTLYIFSLMKTKDAEGKAASKP